MPTFTLTIPNSFTANTKIKSADVNGNFNQVASTLATFLNTTKIDSTNVQLNGLTRDRLATGAASQVVVNDASGNVSDAVANPPAKLPFTVQGADPATPATGVLTLYAKAKKLYTINDAGAVVQVGSGSGGGNINYILNPDAEVDTTGWATYSHAQVGSTITIATPGVITTPAAHGFSVNQAVIFSTTGALPTGLTAGTTYYVSVVGSATTFQVAATAGGASIATSGTQSGSHTVGPVVPLSGTAGTATTTLTRTSVSPVRSTGSFLITKDANTRVGEGVSYDFTIDQVDAGSTLGLSFNYITAAPFNVVGSSDIQVYIYDKTNNQLITPIAKNLSVLSGLFSTTFTTNSSSTSYRLILHIASFNASAYTIKYDTVAVGPQSAILGMSGSNTKNDLTWTYDNLGTVSANNVFYSRIGDRLRVSGNVTAGTVVASTFAINLPSSLNIDSAKATSQQELGMLQTLTTAIPSAGAGPYALFYDGSSTSKVFMAVTASAGSYTKATGSNVGTGSVSSFWFEVPIAGWDANVTMAQSSTFSISSYLANGTRVTTTPANLGEYRARYKSAINSQVIVDTAPTVAPTASDGVRIYGNVPYNAAGTAGQASTYDIFVGKNKNVFFRVYSSAGKTGAIESKYYLNGGTQEIGAVTSYDPSTGVATIDAGYITSGGSTTRFLGVTPGAAGTFVTDGYADIIVSENALAVGVQSPRSRIWLDTANGYGSINTAIPRFTNNPKAEGTALTYTDSATAGMSIKVNEDGIYGGVVSFDMGTAAGGGVAVTLNGVTLTTATASLNIPTSEVLARDYRGGAAGSSGVINLAFGPEKMSAGDVVRVFVDGNTPNTASRCIFRMNKVSN